MGILPVADLNTRNGTLGVSKVSSRQCLFSQILILACSPVSQVVFVWSRHLLNKISFSLFVAVTYVTPGGRRVTSEYAYLTPEVLARPNLKVITQAHVRRVLFDQSGETPRAVGAEFSQPNGDVFQVKARKEVVLRYAEVTVFFLVAR